MTEQPGGREWRNEESRHDLHDWETGVARAEGIAARVGIASGALLMIVGALYISPVGDHNRALLLYGFEGSLLSLLGLGVMLVWRVKLPAGRVVPGRQRSIGREGRDRSISSGRPAGD